MRRLRRNLQKIFILIMAFIGIFTLNCRVYADGPNAEMEGDYRLHIWYRDCSNDSVLSGSGNVVIQYGTEVITGSINDFIPLDAEWEKGKEIKLLSIPVPEGYEVAFTGEPILKFGKGGYDIPGQKLISCMIPLIKSGDPWDFNKINAAIEFADEEQNPMRLYQYTGRPVTPRVNVFINNQIELKEGLDYTVSYERNINPGMDPSTGIHNKAKVIVTGIGKYTGEKVAEFHIMDVPVSDSQDSDSEEKSENKENETKKPPKVNSSIISGGINYKVTKLSGKTGEVTLTKPKVKKAQVVIPDTVKSNGYSFKVTGISKKAFCNNHKLKKVVLGKYIKTIGKQAFQGCTALTSVRLNSQLVTIGDSAFQSCKKMKSIVIPGKVKTIGKKAFYGDEKLASIVVKTKVLNSVGSNAIKGISKKAKISDPTGMIAPASSKSKKISLNKTSLKLAKGKTETLKIKGTSKKARWTSSNKKVATVSSKGKVTAKKKGSAKITALIGNKKYTCKVTVR